jgi:hypothetical protein
VTLGREATSVSTVVQIARRGVVDRLIRTLKESFYERRVQASVLCPRSTSRLSTSGRGYSFIVVPDITHFQVSEPTPWHPSFFLQST